MAMNEVTSELKEYNKQIVRLLKELEAQKAELAKKQTEYADYEPVSRAALMTTIEEEIMDIFYKQKEVEKVILERSFSNGEAQQFLEQESEKRAAESTEVVAARVENNEISVFIEIEDKLKQAELDEKLYDNLAKKKTVIEKAERLKELVNKREEIVKVKKKYEELQGAKEKIEGLIKKHQKNKGKVEKLEVELAKNEDEMNALRNSNPDLFNGEEYDDSMLQEVRKEEDEIYQFLKDNGIKDTKNPDKIIKDTSNAVARILLFKGIPKLYTSDQIAEMKARVVEYAITKQGAEIGISYEEARKLLQDKFFSNEEIIMEGKTIELTEEQLKQAALEHLNERDEKALEETIAEPVVEEPDFIDDENDSPEYDEQTDADKKKQAEGPQEPINPNQKKEQAKGQTTQNTKRVVQGVSNENYQVQPSQQANMRQVAADYRGREFPDADIKGKGALKLFFAGKTKVEAETYRIAAALNYGNPDFKMPTDRNSVQYKEYKEKLRLYANLNNDKIEESLKKGYNLHEMAMDSKVAYKQLDLAKKAIKKEGFRDRIKVEPILEAAKERIKEQAKVQTKKQAKEDEGR